jgi:hypothetical protein
MSLTKDIKILDKMIDDKIVDLILNYEKCSKSKSEKSENCKNTLDITGDIYSLCKVKDKIKKTISFNKMIDTLYITEFLPSK